MSKVSIDTLATQYRIVSSTGSYATTGSLSASTEWAGAVAAYKMDLTTPTVSMSDPTEGQWTTATPTFSGTAGDAERQPR